MTYRKKIKAKKPARVRSVPTAEMQALRWAIEQAADWRGSLTGHNSGDEQSIRDEIERLGNFDDYIAKAWSAYKTLRKMNIQKRRKTK